ncbi:hypothetical protein [Nocardioides alcanivorans]|uniref:hypothetical protein n=1 Tax=Nocardioides alcanivorans TaxID=2897352 RepID=UPI001F268AAF|nr:hypothetical protein [Nocardioides alcanivorans]
MSRFASVILSSTASLVLTLALAGCGDDAAEAGEESSTPAASTPAGSAATGGGADDGLCDVLAISDVADSFGVEIATDSVGAGSSNENDVVWKYTTCTWETDDVIEVRLAVSVADDFPGGELACPPLSYLGTEGEPVAGLEARAWWVESGFNEEEEPSGSAPTPTPSTSTPIARSATSTWRRSGRRPSSSPARC